MGFAAEVVRLRGRPCPSGEEVWDYTGSGPGYRGRDYAVTMLVAGNSIQHATECQFHTEPRDYSQAMEIYNIGIEGLEWNIRG